MGMAPIEPFESRGFRERPDADGRLLGHFPYREALIEQLIVFQPGVELHVDTAEALNSMMNAASADGVDLRLLSGYRSQSLQESIFFDVASERNQTPEERLRFRLPLGIPSTALVMRSISAMERLQKPTYPRSFRTLKPSDGFKITLLVITSSLVPRW